MAGTLAAPDDTTNNTPPADNSNTPPADKTPPADNTPPADKTVDAAKAEEARRAALTDEQRKAEDDAKAAEEAKEAKRKENFGAPEQYEFKTPEGKQPLPTDKLTEIAKELDLSPKAAQRIYDLGQEITDRYASAIQSTIEKTRTDWETQARADKELAGEDGKQLDANLAIARKSLDAYGTPELRTLLNDSGFGNNPEFVRYMLRSGKALMQDEHVRGQRGGSADRDPRDFYPNSQMNP